MQYSLTPKQAELLMFIKQYMATSGGIAPSYDEMLTGTGQSSKSEICRILKGLKERGHIDMMHNRRRSIVLLAAVEQGK